MKLLFVTARWDPKDPDSGAGVNFNAYQALKEWADEIQIAGPFGDRLTLIERGIRKIAGWFTDKRFIKFYPSYIKQSNAVVQKMISDFEPDVIFSKSSIPLVNVNLPMPLVYMCDSSIKWVTENWQPFSKLGLWIMERWERTVINKAAHIITFSKANADVLINYYHKAEDLITTHPIPSSLPQNLCSYNQKLLESSKSLNLLLVGKEFHRKGVDIAIETTQILNEKCIPTTLRIVGQDGTSSENVQFMGLYSKNNPDELIQYINQYRWAHFFIFPSRFDAAGIVPSEAAGFGVPTITNAAGGLATTVKDGVSGVVLEKDSPASQYAETIQHYWENPVEYHNLCLSTYDRYLTELNWDALGGRLREIIEKVVRTQGQ